MHVVSVFCSPHSYNHEEWEMDEAGCYVPRRRSSFEKNLMSRKEYLTNWGVFLFFVFLASAALLMWTLYELHQNWGVMEQSFQDDNASDMFVCMILAVTFVVCSAVGWFLNRKKLLKLR
jgi:hypothetical protein